MKRINRVNQSNLEMENRVVPFVKYFKISMLRGGIWHLTLCFLVNGNCIDLIQYNYLIFSAVCSAYGWRYA